VVSGQDRETGKGVNQIWLASIDGASQRQLTWNEGSHSSPVWSPDGRSIAFVGEKIDGPEQSLGNTHSIFVLAMDGGEARELTSHLDGPSQLAWSPESLSLLLFVSDHYSVGGVFVLHDLATDGRRHVTDDWDRALEYADGMAWTEGRRVLIGGYERSRSGLWWLDIDSGKVAQIKLDDFYEAGVVTVAGRSTIIRTRSGSDGTGELVAYDPDVPEAPTRITHLNDDFLAESPSAPIERLSVKHEHNSRSSRRSRSRSTSILPGRIRSSSSCMAGRTCSRRSGMWK